MSLLEETKEWLKTTSPDRDEVQMTIDNFAHAFGYSAPERRSEIKEVIDFLCSQAMIESADISLPEPAGNGSESLLDASPLGGPTDDSWEEMTAESKAKRFLELKESLARPF